MAKIFLTKLKKLPFNAQIVADEVMKVLGQTGRVNVEIDIVSEDYIKEINNKFRNVDRVTDVLSFPSLDGVRYKDIKSKDYPLDVIKNKGVFLGSIIICDKRAKEQALEYNHSEDREFSYLFCHGLLHLFGYDHLYDKDDLEMRELTNKVLQNLEITR